MDSVSLLLPTCFSFNSIPRDKTKNNKHLVSFLLHRTAVWRIAVHLPKQMKTNKQTNKQTNSSVAYTAENSIECKRFPHGTARHSACINILPTCWEKMTMTRTCFRLKSRSRRLSIIVTRRIQTKFSSSSSSFSRFVFYVLLFFSMLGERVAPKRGRAPVVSLRHWRSCFIL